VCDYRVLVDKLSVVVFGHALGAVYIRRPSVRRPTGFQLADRLHRQRKSTVAAGQLPFATVSTSIGGAYQGWGGLIPPNFDSRRPKYFTVSRDLQVRTVTEIESARTAIQRIAPTLILLFR